MKRVVVTNRPGLGLAVGWVVCFLICWFRADVFWTKFFAGFMLAIGLLLALVCPFCVIDADSVRLVRFWGLIRRRIPWNEIRSVRYEIKLVFGGRWSAGQEYKSMVHISCQQWKEIEFSLDAFVLDWQLATYLRTVHALDNRDTLPPFPTVQRSQFPKHLAPWSRIVLNGILEGIGFLFLILFFILLILTPHF